MSLATTCPQTNISSSLLNFHFPVLSFFCRNPMEFTIFRKRILSLHCGCSALYLISVGCIDFVGAAGFLDIDFEVSSSAVTSAQAPHPSPLHLMKMLNPHHQGSRKHLIYFILFSLICPFGISK